ncbi:MFS transporter [Candidatus Poribacteria bacterium]|nr:MFS transporter [Candidatus Poribacteria bacterium]
MGTICYFLYGFMALPGGFIADKLGYKVVLGAFFIGTPLAACVVGSANSVFTLGLGLALLGLFASLYHPSGLSMISHNVRTRGKALGLHGMGGNLGLAFSPVIAGTIAMRLSWRYSYYLLSLPGFVAGIIFLFSLRTILKSDDGSEADYANININQQNHKLRFAAIFLLYAAMTLNGFCYRGMITMLPTYLGKFEIDTRFVDNLKAGNITPELRKTFKDNDAPISEDATLETEEKGRKWLISQGKSKYTVINEGNGLNVYGRHAAKGGLFATMVLLVGMIGQYMGGHFSDKHRKTRLYLLFNSISLPFMILIGLLSGYFIIVVAALFALFHFANQPVENNLIAQYTSSKLRSSGYGLKFFLTFGIGSFAAGFSGYVADNFGFNSVFLVLGGVIFLIVLVLILLNIYAGEKVGNSQ